MAIYFIYQIALEYNFTLCKAVLHPPPFLDSEPYNRGQSYKSFPSSSARTWTTFFQKKIIFFSKWKVDFFFTLIENHLKFTFSEANRIRYNRWWNFSVSWIKIFFQLEFLQIFLHENCATPYSHPFSDWLVDQSLQNTRCRLIELYCIRSNP